MWLHITIVICLDIWIPCSLCVCSYKIHVYLFVFCMRILKFAPECFRSCRKDLSINWQAPTNEWHISKQGVLRRNAKWLSLSRVVLNRFYWQFLRLYFYISRRFFSSRGMGAGMWEYQPGWSNEQIMTISICMMTSSNGSIFRVTGPFCGEFTGPGDFPAQRPVTRSFDVFFDLRLNKRLSKQPWGWWFETPAWSLWRHRNGPAVPFSDVIFSPTQLPSIGVFV